MTNLMSLQVEELESLDAATADECECYWEALATGLIIGAALVLLT